MAHHHKSHTSPSARSASHCALHETFAPFAVKGFSLAGCLLFLLTTLALAQPDPVRYTVSLSGYRDHILHVQCELPAGEATQTIQLPVWNALYQVRDFSQYINWLRATSPSGAALPVRELDKSSWRIDNSAQGAVVDYEIFADNPGPYGAQINDRHAFLNLAEVLVYPVSGRAWPVQLRFTNAPSGWKFATALEQTVDGFHASNYDRLVDGPIEVGVFRETAFDEGGARYRVVVDADPSDYDINRLAGNLHKIVVAATSWMNDRPYTNYVFLYHFPHGPGGGGMEHAYSTAIEVNADVARDTPESVLDVSAHEFFHLWNVKRIRPQSLEPIDYTQENYTTALWFSEGATSTVEDILLLRAGLMDEPRYLQRLGRQITELQQRPAHRTQSVEDSSRNAWLEKYSYYFQATRSISYYNKGDLLGVLLDLSIRESSHGHASLREAMQWLNEHYAKQSKFFPDSAGVREAAEAVGGTDLSSFFEHYVTGTDEVPWDDWLGTVGLRAVLHTVTVPDAGFVAARSFDKPAVVLSVRPDSDAARAGLLTGDTILAVNDQTGANSRAATPDVDARLAAMHPGDTITVRVRNRQGEHELHWKLAGREETEYEVKDREHVSAAQRARRAAWLKGEAEPDTSVHAGAAEPSRTAHSGGSQPGDASAPAGEARP